MLVLYNVPKAGQQRAGIEAFLKKGGKLWALTKSSSAVSILWCKLKSSNNEGTKLTPPLMKTSYEHGLME